MNKQMLKKLAFPAAILLFGALCLCTYRMAGDDFILYYSFEREDCRSVWMPNGRYLSNSLAYVMLRIPVLRWIIYLSAVLALVWLTGNLVPKCRQAVRWIALGMFLLTPPQLFNQIFTWISAFPVYILPVITTFCFLYVFLRDDGSELKHGKLLTVLFLAAGAAGALCVEHMTIYSMLLAVFVLIWCGVKKGLHIRGYQISYAIGTLAGAAVMFTNSNYHTIADTGDEIGERTMEFAFSDISQALYSKVIPMFAKQFFPIHIILAVCMLYLYIRHNGCPESDKTRRRYTKFSLAAVCGYAIYSFFTVSVTDLEELSPDMRVRALECAFAFLYIIGLIYLSYVLCGGQSCFRTALFLTSALICSAVFCVASPVNDRCFFSDYCFWILAALEAVQQCLLAVSVRRDRITTKVAAGAVAAVFCLLANILITNRVAESLLISHLREQSEKGIKNYELITAPYPAYGAGSTGLFYASLLPTYGECFQQYYDLDVEIDTDKEYRLISVYDWFM